MTKKSWNWKPKDGAHGGLLYESGNWGDFLKVFWLAALFDWRRQNGLAVNYLDPFAGDVDYPLGRKTAYRFRQAAFPGIDCVREPFIDRGRWPSSAGLARLLDAEQVEVFDADPGRRERWRSTSGVTVAEAESGWEVLEKHSADAAGIWLIDPYDFLAEWRERLSSILDRARDTTTLVYIYNRSAKNAATFREYRAFRNALEDAWGEWPKRLGRVAADVFLPQAHHEILLLPGRRDREHPAFEPLLDELGRRAAHLAATIGRSGACDC